MIKKFSLTNLSLKKQLVVIILIIAMVLGILAHFLLTTKINDFVNREMYGVISTYQNQIIFRYKFGITKVEQLFDTNNSSITHFIYDHDKNVLLGNSIEKLSDSTVEQLLIKSKQQSAQTQNYELFGSQTKNLYTITKIDDDTSIISIMNATYRDDFHTLLSDLVLVVVLVSLLVMLAIFLVWLSSIINPLNQIVKYLTSPKQTKKIGLDHHRQDEIGDVIDSIMVLEEEIKKQERIKMEMIHNISHDLKTPITTIKSYSESIKDGIYPYKTLEKSLDVIIENADRLERKAHSLLLLNQIEALENQTVENVPFAMKEVVNKVLLSLKVVRPEIEIKTTLRNVLFFGEEENWRICIENLLENALRYAKSEVIVDLDEDVITVFNDGSHMDADRVEKLFKPYEKGTDGQFGLGLSIVYRLSKRMGYQTSGYNKNDGVEFKIEKIKDESTLRQRRNKRKSIK